MKKSENQKEINTFMEILIQRTKTKDFQTTENITREAFWNLFKPGCDEHLVLHNLRKSNFPKKEKGKPKIDINH